MATGMLLEIDGLDDKRYERINDALDLYNNPPKGLIFHTAGPTNSGGWRVLDIWESKDLFDRFFRQRLQPAFNQVGLNEPPSRQEFFPIHNAYVPQPTLLNNLPHATAGARR